MTKNIEDLILEFKKLHTNNFNNLDFYNTFANGA